MALGFVASGVLASGVLAGCGPAVLASAGDSDGGSFSVRRIGNLVVEEKSPVREDKVVRTEEEWKKRLTPEQMRILRRKGTEPAFCSGFLSNKEVGVYHCVGCDLPLFSTDTKFDSGTGWPSFFQPVERGNIWLKTDLSFGMVRVEVLCSRCDGHLGHVFDDGPRAGGGLRFCINGEILRFVEKQETGGDG